ncbi:hypothetical protein JZ751_029331 [Albula glossodonta]|uniref:Uncharacterized protein n=1 Tax=Albula glossodonta TaxID=121402 RepID=A0A8T2P669_9TELE|nr:hypothetical protein JZ751_029331 [Albula glossodonta]
MGLDLGGVGGGSLGSEGTGDLQSSTGEQRHHYKKDNSNERSGEIRINEKSKRLERKLNYNEGAGARPVAHWPGALRRALPISCHPPAVAEACNFHLRTTSAHSGLSLLICTCSRQDIQPLSSNH